MAKENKTGVSVQEVPKTSVDSFISQAIEKGAPVEMMERLFALHKEVAAEHARTAYTEALASFQEECPIIEKTKNVMNKDGRTVRYSYAPIDSIVSQIRKPLASNKLAYTWNVSNKEGKMEVICKVTHILGHSETSTFEIPIDQEGYMTQPQKYASAQTFAKRYTLCNALGISTGEDDTDATDVEKEPVAKSDKAKIIFLLRTLGKVAITKEEIAGEVSKLTGLALEEKNYGEIVGRLEVIVQEKNSDATVEIQ